MVGRLDFSNAGPSTYVVNKTGAYTINVTGSAVSPVLETTITGGATVTGENTGNITWASNGGTNYFDSIRLGVAAATVFNFEDTAAEFATGTLTNTTAYTAGLGLSN